MRRTHLLVALVAALALQDRAMAAERLRETEPSLELLGGTGETVLRDYLLDAVRGQYDERRREMEQALRSRAGIEHRQNNLRVRYRELVGPLPERTSLEARVTGRIDEEDYFIEKVAFRSRPGIYVTANVYVPRKAAGPFPAVLIPCGHSVFGKADRNYQTVALGIVSQGMIALVFDPLGQAERRPPWVSGNRASGAIHAEINISGAPVGESMIRHSLWDGVRCLDYLATRPDVDHGKPFGMTGNSGGGAQTMYLMGWDDRIGPAAPSCHVTTLERSYELGSPTDGCQAFSFTGKLRLDHPDFLMVRAPRPTLILAAERDYKDITSTRKTFAEAQTAYDLLGQKPVMQLFAFDDEHGFSKPRREQAVRWMKRWLLGKDEPFDEPEFKLQTPEALQVTRSGLVEREFTDAVSVDALHLRRAKELGPERERFHGLPAQERTRRVQALLSTREPGMPAVRKQDTIHRDGYSIEKWLIARPDEVVLPALRFVPTRAGHALPAVLYLDGRGKATDAKPGGLIEALVKSGRIVLAVDLRGIGETADQKKTVYILPGEFRTAMWSLHIGKPLLGQRVEDAWAARKALADCQDVDPNQIDIVAIGLAGPVGLHLTFLDSKVRRCRLTDTLSDWAGGVVARPTAAGNVIGHVVPGVLESYDLPDLEKLLGTRVTRHEPASGR